MIRTLRFGALALVLWVGAVATAVAAQSAQSSANPLRVVMVPATGEAAGQFLGSIKFSMTNTAREPVRVLSWQTPLYGLENNLFDVYLGSEKIPYTGMYVKRGEPTAADYITFAPGQTLSVVIDLSDNYDLSTSGQYQVQYHTLLQGAQVGNRIMAKAGGGMAELSSFPLVLWVDGSDLFLGTQPKSKAQSAPIGVSALNPAPAYEKCTTTQQSQLVSALDGARAYAANGRSYLNSNNQGLRYTTWFGAITAARYTTANSHFNALDSTLTSQTVTFNCGCKKKYYAYVYPNDPYRIYVCSVFWQAPNTGTDSRAGTIIHETSHFTVVAGTDDWVYGQAGAKNLASTNPDKALDNADNHEYFGENNPFQN